MGENNINIQNGENNSSSHKSSHTTLGPVLLTLIAGGDQGKNEITIQEGGVDISLILKNMVRIKSDAYVVPHFNGAASYDGVGGAVITGGALNGMETYRKMVVDEVEGKGEKLQEKQMWTSPGLETPPGPQEWSKATLTESGGGNSKFLIHVVSVNSSAEDEFSVITGSVLNALIEANKKGLETVVFPALGTGHYGHLLPKQSANAIMHGIGLFKQYLGEDKTAQSVKKVTIAIYQDELAFERIKEVLTSGSYASALPEVGEKQFDYAKWRLSRIPKN